jgi:hypothetical protein
MRVYTVGNAQNVTTRQLVFSHRTLVRSRWKDRGEFPFYSKKYHSAKPRQILPKGFFRARAQRPL